MNSLELFNQIYKNDKSRHYEKSLMDFFQTNVASRIHTDSQILDLGPGSKSLFEDTKQLQVTAVDFSSEAIDLSLGRSHVAYQVKDISLPGALEAEAYDLVFDSHCLHCITDLEKRQRALTNIYQSLKNDGIFCAEMMVAPAGKPTSIPNKYVASARELEEEILGHGFKIIYFMIVRDLIFSNENGECDLVRVIGRK